MIRFIIFCKNIALEKKIHSQIWAVQEFFAHNYQKSTFFQKLKFFPLSEIFFYENGQIEGNKTVSTTVGILKKS